MEAGSVPPQSVIETLGALASCNVNGVMPYVKPILGILIPSLSSIKQDGLRIAISIMFAKFCETTLDAIANKDSDSDLDIDKFNTECDIIYESLVNLWLRSSNPSVRNETILALGHMSHIINKDKLNMLGGVIVMTIISLYKKSSSPFSLTFSLSLITDAIVKSNLHECIKLHVDNMLATLFNQVCVPPNFAEPLTVKNHCEVLRCYEILAKNFPDSVLQHTLSRLENASHIQRVGALIVSKHLINSKSLSNDNISQIVNVLPLLLQDPNSKVVKSVTQVIVALCHNSHLESSTGAPFVSYLVKHCAGGCPSLERRNSLSSVGEESVGEVCSRALNLLSTTMVSAIPILWPHLLLFVCGSEHEASLPTILSCLAHLSSLPETSDVKEDSPLLSGGSGPPTPPVLLTRLMVLSSSPDFYNIGTPSLSLLKGLAPHFSPKVEEFWMENLPILIKTYNELSNKSADPSALQMWQDTLRDFLADTIKKVSSEDFTCNIGVAQMEQLANCDKHQGRRCFLMSMIGVILKHSNNKTFVAITLDSLYGATNHKSSAEQESFALALGLCAATHTDLVLTHLDGWLKTSDPSKKSISFFSLIKQQDPRVEEAIWIRSSIVLALGQIASLTPPEVVGSRVDGPIMLHLLNIINSNKSDIVNDVVLQSISKIAKALLRLPGFKLRQRPLLITHLVNTIQQNHISLLSLGSTIQALRDLTALEPVLNVEERTIILQACLIATLNKLHDIGILDSGIIKCYSQLNVLLRTVIQRDTNPAVLDDITTLLHSWTISPSELVRMKSMDLLLSSFNTYYHNLNLTPENPTSFNQTCQLLALIIPRIGESNPDMRSQSVGCCSIILKIAGRYLGHPSDYTDNDLDLLKKCEDDIGKCDVMDIDGYISTIGKVISNKLTFVQLRSFLGSTIGGLQDRVSSGAKAVATVLCTIFTLRGHQLHQHIKELLDAIYGRLEKVVDPETRHRTVDSICNLSTHNLTLIIDTLLDYPLPYERGICETWQRLGCDEELCKASIAHLIQILERTPPYTEQSTAMGEKVKIATLLPLAAISAITELLKELVLKSNIKSNLNESEKPSSSVGVVESSVRNSAIENLPSMAVLSVTLYGCYVGVVAPLHQSGGDGSKNAFIPNRGATTLKPTREALNCLQSILGVISCPKLYETLNNLMAQTNDEEDLDQFLSNINVIVS